MWRNKKYIYICKSNLIERGCYLPYTVSERCHSSLESKTSNPSRWRGKSKTQYNITFPTFYFEKII